MLWLCYNCWIKMTEIEYGVRDIDWLFDNERVWRLLKRHIKFKEQFNLNAKKEGRVHMETFPSFLVPKNVRHFTVAIFRKTYSCHRGNSERFFQSFLLNGMEGTGKNCVINLLCYYILQERVSFQIRSVSASASYS